MVANVGDVILENNATSLIALHAMDVESMGAFVLPSPIDMSACVVTADGNFRCDRKDAVQIVSASKVGFHPVAITSD